MAVARSTTEKTAMRLVQRAKKEGPSGGGGLMRRHAPRQRGRTSLTAGMCDLLRGIMGACASYPRARELPVAAENNAESGEKQRLPTESAAGSGAPQTCWPPLMCSSAPCT